MEADKMTNKKLKPWLLISTLILTIKIWGMEEKHKDLSLADYDSLAQEFIQINSSKGYQAMCTAIFSQGHNLSSNRYTFFNKICKSIMYLQENCDIFVSEYLRIRHAEHFKIEQLYDFFNQFIPKLRVCIIIGILECVTKLEISIDEVNFLYNMIFNYASSLNDPLFACRLAATLREFKNFLMQEYFDTMMNKFRDKNMLDQSNSKADFHELLDCSLFLILQRLCIAISDLALKITNKQEFDSVKCMPRLESRIKSLFDLIFRGEEEGQDISDLKKLSTEDRSKMITYLFSTFFVLNTEYLAAYGSMANKISLILDNHVKPLDRLNDDELLKRIDDLTIVLDKLSGNRPRAYILSQSIMYPNLLGPMARSIYFLNTLIMRCLVNKIVRDLVGIDPECVSNNLCFLAEVLGPKFYCKGLLLVKNEIINLIKSKTQCKDFYYKMVEALKIATHLLNLEDMVDKPIIKFTAKICENLMNYLDMETSPEEQPEETEKEKEGA